MDFHHDERDSPVERDRSPGRGGRCAQGLGRCTRERLPRNRDQGLGRRESQPHTASGAPRLGRWCSRRCSGRAGCFAGCGVWRSKHEYWFGSISHTNFFGRIQRANRSAPGFRSWRLSHRTRLGSGFAADDCDEWRRAIQNASEGTPFGVPPSVGTWGGSGAVVDMAIRVYFLHKAFPDLVSSDYTLRAVNYILGTHPVSSTSYVAGVGTVPKTQTYSNNRADNAYIPGAVIPGYVIIKPDFPECIDDFGFLWFEDEAVVAGSASWVVAGNAAVAIIRESK